MQKKLFHKPMKISGVILICVMFWGNSYAQRNKHDGFPIISNYSPSEYKGYVQNWGFAEDSNGIIYFANQGQVITFDGVNWKKIFIENQRAYSIVANSSGKVFVGGENQIGYLDNAVDDSITRKQFFSLNHLIKKYEDFGIVWKIFAYKDAIYFMANKYLLVYKNEEITQLKTEKSFQNVFALNGTLVVNVVNEGLYKVENNELLKFPKGDFFKNESTASWAQVNEEYFFCGSRCTKFEHSEFFKLTTKADAYLSKFRAYDMVYLDDGTLLLGTLGGGLVHINKYGELIHIYTEKEGLINNQILDLYRDSQNRVWVATYNGISMLEFDTPIRFFNSNYGIKTMVRSLSFLKNEVYATSTAGLYRYSKLENSFINVENINGTCKNLKSLGANLIMTCNNTLIELDKGKSKELANSIQNFFISDNTPNILYLLKDSNEIDVVKKSGAKISSIYHIKSFDYSVETMAEDKEGNLWFGSVSSGVLRVKFERKNQEIIAHELTKYSLKNNGFDKSIRIQKLGNKIAFYSSSGIFRFDNEKSRFVLESQYGKELADSTQQVFMSAEDIKGNAWFRTDQSFIESVKGVDGFYKIKKGFLNRIHASQINDMKVDSSGYLWIATNEGIIRFNTLKNTGFENNFFVQINDVLVKNDSLINGGVPKDYVLSYKENELRFTYSAASYDEPYRNNFQVQLAGFDSNWSSWTSETQKDYTNIPEGNYVFKVRSKNIYGVVSESKSFTFTILPPWYRTWWSYILYIALVGASLYLMYKIRVNQILRVQKVRNRIADDLHDDLSGTLIGISNFAKAISTNPDSKVQQRFLGLIEKSADEAKEKISDIVWTINPVHDDWLDFLTKCRRHASDIFEAQKIEYSLEMDDNIPGDLDMELRKNLWLIFKEIITNITKHSGADYVLVRFKTDHKKLSILIKDNGSGFEINKKEQGNGIVSIKRRADKINAEIELVTEIDQGTFWNVVINL